METTRSWLESLMSFFVGRRETAYTGVPVRHHRRLRKARRHRSRYATITARQKMARQSRRRNRAS